MAALAGQWLTNAPAPGTLARQWLDQTVISMIKIWQDFDNQATNDGAVNNLRLIWKAIVSRELENANVNWDQDEQALEADLWTWASGLPGYTTPTEDAGYSIVQIIKALQAFGPVPNLNSRRWMMAPVASKQALSMVVEAFLTNSNTAPVVDLFSDPTKDMQEKRQAIKDWVDNNGFSHLWSDADLNPQPDDFEGWFMPEIENVVRHYHILTYINLLRLLPQVPRDSLADQPRKDFREAFLNVIVHAWMMSPTGDVDIAALVADAGNAAVFGGWSPTDIADFSAWAGPLATNGLKQIGADNPGPLFWVDDMGGEGSGPNTAGDNIAPQDGSAGREPSPKKDPLAEMRSMVEAEPSWAGADQQWKELFWILEPVFDDLEMSEADWAKTDAELKPILAAKIGGLAFADPTGLGAKLQPYGALASDDAFLAWISPIVRNVATWRMVTMQREMMQMMKWSIAFGGGADWQDKAAALISVAMGITDWPDSDAARVAHLWTTAANTAATAEIATLAETNAAFKEWASNVITVVMMEDDRAPALRNYFTAANPTWRKLLLAALPSLMSNMMNITPDNYKQQLEQIFLSTAQQWENDIPTATTEVANNDFKAWVADVAKSLLYEMAGTGGEWTVLTSTKDPMWMGYAAAINGLVGPKFGVDIAVSPNAVENHAAVWAAIETAAGDAGTPHFAAILAMKSDMQFVHYVNSVTDAIMRLENQNSPFFEFLTAPEEQMKLIGDTLHAYMTTTDPWPDDEPGRATMGTRILSEVATKIGGNAPTLITDADFLAKFTRISEAAMAAFEQHMRMDVTWMVMQEVDILDPTNPSGGGGGEGSVATSINLGDNMRECRKMGKQCPGDAPWVTFSSAPRAWLDDLATVMSFLAGVQWKETDAEKEAQTFTAIQDAATAQTPGAAAIQAKIDADESGYVDWLTEAVWSVAEGTDASESFIAAPGPWRTAFLDVQRTTMQLIRQWAHTVDSSNTPSEDQARQKMWELFLQAAVDLEITLPTGEDNGQTFEQWARSLLEPAQMELGMYFGMSPWSNIMMVGAEGDEYIQDAADIIKATREWSWPASSWERQYKLKNAINTGALVGLASSLVDKFDNPHWVRFINLVVEAAQEPGTFQNYMQATALWRKAISVAMPVIMNVTDSEWPTEQAGKEQLAWDKATEAWGYTTGPDPSQMMSAALGLPQSEAEFRPWFTEVIWALMMDPTIMQMRNMNNGNPGDDLPTSNQNGDAAATGGAGPMYRWDEGQPEWRNEFEAIFSEVMKMQMGEEFDKLDMGGKRNAVWGYMAANNLIKRADQEWMVWVLDIIEERMTGGFDQEMMHVNEIWRTAFDALKMAMQNAPEVDMKDMSHKQIRDKLNMFVMDEVPTALKFLAYNNEFVNWSTEMFLRMMREDLGDDMPPMLGGRIKLWGDEFQFRKGDTCMWADSEPSMPANVE
eukprot:TRINITY_DN54609_c0_g1_i1.p1 TRINITY_DN54609_c0_g1~~TRINITY_DN54609_c0_g1_i1.p1  ORF type:complete len:1570 (+),score=305.04 TRINITY_DN54609_c0_g1_i1:411-4712(+)